MKRKRRQSSALKLFILFAVAAASLPAFGFVRRWAAIESLETAPFRTTVISGPRGLASTRHSYVEGPFAVMEIGSLRIAREHGSLGGRSSNGGQGLLIQPNQPIDLACSRGTTGVGDKQVSYVGIEGGVRFSCDGLTFDVAGGKFIYRDISVSALESPILVVVAKDGTVMRVSKIEADGPASGTLSAEGFIVSDRSTNR